MQVNADQQSDQSRFTVAKFRKSRRFMKANWMIATFVMATLVGWMTLR
jgi:hypothetical protein